MVLKKNNFVVDTVADGQAAIDYLGSGIYDCVILDIMMPKADGITVLNTIRKQNNPIPVLILSAKSEIEDKVNGLNTLEWKLASLLQHKRKNQGKSSPGAHSPEVSSVRSGCPAVLSHRSHIRRPAKFHLYFGRGGDAHHHGSWRRTISRIPRMSGKC